MAIDFDKAKKNIGKSYDKTMGAWEKEHQKQFKAQQEAEKQAKLEKLKKAKKTTKTPNGHTVNAGGRKQLTPEAKLELERQQATNAVPKFLRNMTEAVIDNSVLGGITTLAYGKKPSSDFDSPYYDEIHSGTSATLGRLTGQGAMFASQFAAGSAPLNKISQAIAKTKLGQAVAKSVIGDATIGLGQNIVMAKGEGLEGEDLVKDVALNTGLDLALGAGLEVIPAAKSYLKNTKLAKQAKNVGEVADTTKKVAETGNLGVKNTLSDAQKVNSGTISDAKRPAKIESNTRLSGNDLDEYMSVGSKTARRVKAKNIETGTSPILTSPDEIKKYIDDSISGIESNSTKGYGRVGKSLADDVKAKTNGEVDLYGKYLELNSDDLRHSSKRHSLPKRDGDIPLSVVDFENIPDYIDNYDDILDIVQTKDGLRIQLGKKINGYSVITEIVQDSRNSLKFKNMWGVSTEKYLREYKNKRIRYRATSNNAIGREASYTFSELPLNKTLPQSSYEVKPEKANKTLKDLGAVNPDILFVGDKIENAKGLFDRLYKYTVSGQKELERLSKVAGNTKVDDYTQAVRAAKGTVSNIFHDSLVDTAGKVINEKSYKSLIDEIPKNVRKDFQTYAEHLHNIDRVREGVPVYKQYSAEDSQKIVDEMLKKHPEFTQYTKDLNEWWNQFTKAWLLDTGRISKESYEAMLKKYPNYIPTYRVEKGFGGIGSLPNRVNVGSGVKGAKGGESEIIPLEDSFLAQIDRIVSGTRKNDLYTSVIEEIRKNPEQMKSFGVLTENKDILKNDILDNMLSDATIKTKGKDMYEAIVNEMSEVDRRGLQEVKNGVGMVTAYIDGKPVSAYINKDMLDALNLLNDSYDSEVVREISKIGRSITNPVKAGITGYNPLFIISNVSRDLPTLYIQSQHSMWKTTTGLGKAIKAMMTNDEIYKTYKALGGKQSGYYAAGKGFDDALTQKGVKKLWSNVESLMSILGEGTETIPRLAEFINSVEKYGYTKDGLLRAAKDAAESTVNFKRTAPVTKAVDSWVLYLNAAVQGLDKFGRTIKNAPLKTLGRSAAMISVPYVLLTAKNWDNPHYQDLNERTKQNYFCIPNIAGEKDEQGYAKTFIKVPVNREYGAIAAASFDIIFDMLDGKSFEEATKGYSETLKNNFVPPSLEENIFAPITKHLPENKDFAGRSIVPESLVNASPKYQQDYTTSGVARGVANVANFLDDKGLPTPDTLKSPKKVDYLIDSYGGYLGQVAQGATGNNTTDLKSGVEGAFIDPFKQRFTADARFSSGPIAEFYDAKEKALVEKNDAKLEGKETSEGQIKTKVYNKIASEISDLTKEEKQIQSSNLPKTEKDKKVKVLRTKKNELAKSAETEVKKALKEYKQAPTFANLPTKTKEKYNSKAGISKEKWAKAYESQKSEDKYSAKTLAMINNGVTTYEQAKSIFSGISESAFNEGMALHKTGVKIDAVKSAYVKANTNGNSYISKDEAIAYLNSTNYSRAQKRAIFDALMANPKTKNPY